MTDKDNMPRLHLTVIRVQALAAIISACKSESTVTYMRKLADPAQGTASLTHENIKGTARHLVSDEDFRPWSPEDDVRDAFVRVTLDSGMEAVWPVRDLVLAYERGHIKL